MRLDRLTLYLLIIYAALTAYTVATLVVPIPRIPASTIVLTLLAFTVMLLHAGQRLGWGRAGWLIALCFGISLLFECVGVATGLVYGPYHYTDSLGLKFLGLVPLLIPLAWFMMMYPSLVIAQGLTAWRPSKRSRILPILGVSALGGLIMTAWDLVMDPLMVKLGHWVWDGAASTRPYFGVPLQNYWGWWLTTFVIFAIFLSLAPRVGRGQRADPPRPGFNRLALFGYLVTGLGSIGIAFLSGLEGPALVGLFAMAPWAWMAWQKL